MLKSLTTTSVWDLYRAQRVEAKQLEKIEPYSMTSPLG